MAVRGSGRFFGDEMGGGHRQSELVLLRLSLSFDQIEIRIRCNDINCSENSHRFMNLSAPRQATHSNYAHISLEKVIILKMKLKFCGY